MMTDRSPDAARQARLAIGAGHYLADDDPATDLHLAIVRSQHPHATISVDSTLARALPGVRAVLTGADVRPITLPMGMMWNAPIQRSAPTWCLADDRVRYVGEPIAAIVADDPTLASDAAELVEVGYAPLPVAADPDPAGPVLYEDWGDNVFGRTQFEAGDVEAAVRDAAITVTGRYTSSRLAGMPLETRGIRASWSSDGRSLDLSTSTQSPHQVRDSMAHTLNISPQRIRVWCDDVGGSFGNKACPYIEETLVAVAARAARRPVRWIESRTEAFVATVHGRGSTVDLELGLTSDGTIAGLRATVLVDCGATPYMVGSGTGVVTAAMLFGPYRISDARTEMVAVVTNKTPIGAYRGFGMAEATFALERALDEGAHTLGIDPVEIRRRNLLRSHELPHTTPSRLCLDSGRYPEMLDMVADRIDWRETRQTTERARASGRLVGVGLACYVEATNFGPSLSTALMGINSPGHDRAVIRMDSSGDVTVLTGQTPLGQGLDTVLIEVAAREIGVPAERVSLSFGDTLACPYTGYGTGGSRGAGVAGSAVMIAARQMRQNLRTLAAHLLRADTPDAARDVSGGFADETGREVSLAEVAAAAYRATELPRHIQPGLETSHTYDPSSFAFSYGAVAAVVEIDSVTGAVDIQRLVFGHDCGTQLNEDNVAAQIVGGIAQGVGAALYEQLPYRDDGRPAVESLWNYFPPLPRNIPPIELLHLTTPSPYSFNGAKGVGESGVIPIAAVVANAIDDAIGHNSTIPNTLPITAERLLAELDDKAVQPSDLPGHGPSKRGSTTSTRERGKPPHAHSRNMTDVDVSTAHEIEATDPHHLRSPGR